MGFRIQSSIHPFDLRRLHIEAIVGNFHFLQLWRLWQYWSSARPFSKFIWSWGTLKLSQYKLCLTLRNLMLTARLCKQNNTNTPHFLLIFVGKKVALICLFWFFSFLSHFEDWWLRLQISSKDLRSKSFPGLISSPPNPQFVRESQEKALGWTLFNRKFV